MICVAAGGKAMVLAASAFTLAWTHSVEKTRWEERWIAGPEGLTVVEGRIAGSGAGMEPPEGAVLREGAYVWRPKTRPLAVLVLAASGATGSGWTLCPDGGACVELGREAGEPIRVKVCEASPGR